jgi:hypothetical protein
MKRSMKKSAVFVMMAAIAMFILAATVTADPPGNLRGQYAATSEATCMIAPFGFNPNLTPINGLGIISMQNREGIFTFENDSTGSVTQNGSVINLSYIGPGGVTVPPSAASQTISWDFTYTVTDGGMITITQVPRTYFVTFTSGPNKGLTYQVEGVSIKGTITPDGKNITLNGSSSNLFTLSGPNLPPIGSNHSCSSSSVLIWQHNEKP